jgi:lactate dehydrogenase-like 2-hydroxyacid dehydrogenase
MSLISFSEDIEITEIEKKILGSKIAKGNSEQKAIVHMAWNENIDKKFMENRPDLKAVIRYGVGYNNVDISEAKKRGIKVCIVPDYGVEEVAQSAVSFIVSHARNISGYNQEAKERYLKNTWQKINSKVKRISQQTVCIIGVGRIGSSASLLCKAFGFNVILYDPYVSRGYEKVLGIKRCETIKEALEQSDYVTIHVPSNNNKGMINEKFIKNMKDGAVLVNTARGELVKDLDCIQDGIETNKLSAVYLDVLEQEPPIRHEFLDKWRDGFYGPRVVINPHTSFYSDKSFIEMRTKACMSALAILENKEPYCEVKENICRY